MENSGDVRIENDTSDPLEPHNDPFGGDDGGGSNASREMPDLLLDVFSADIDAATSEMDDDLFGGGGVGDGSDVGGGRSVPYAATILPPKMPDNMWCGGGVGVVSPTARIPDDVLDPDGGGSATRSERSQRQRHVKGQADGRDPADPAAASIPALVLRGVLVALVCAVTCPIGFFVGNAVRVVEITRIAARHQGWSGALKWFGVTLFFTITAPIFGLCDGLVDGFKRGYGSPGASMFYVTRIWYDKCCENYTSWGILIVNGITGF